jgi:hypothetical protein
MNPRALFARGLAVALLAALPGHGQIEQRSRAETAAPARSLKARVGLDAARVLLRSDDSADRKRAFERLAELGSETALELLARSLDLNGTARDGRERLAATRALAPHAKSQVVRTALIRSLSAPSALERSDPKLALARETAALALARSGEPRALAALGQALRQPGRGAEAALSALRAYPAADASPTLTARGAVTAIFVDYLETLNDPRASGLLHAIARRSAPELRARALVALARRKDPTVTELVARSYRNEPHPGVFEASVEVLARARHPDAKVVFAKLCEAGEKDPDALDRAIEIALAAPSPRFAEALERAIPKASAAQQARLVAALGKASGPPSVAALGRLLNLEATSFAAAHALALDDSEAALDVLERALSGSALLRRTALRAAAVRAVALDEIPSGAATRAEELLRSRAPEDRAAAAFALSSFEPERGSTLVASSDPVVARAAARAMLASGFTHQAAARLVIEADALTRSALALALADDDAALRVPSSVLEDLLEGSEAAAPLAARTLAARDSERFRSRVERLLGSADSRLRAHAASGLGLSRQPSAVGLLERVYVDEVDPVVRRAIVRALGVRSDPGRRRVLDLAAALDPDDEARTLARRALAGDPAPAFTPGKASAWLTVESPRANEAAIVSTPGGLALPAAIDPDGFAALSGLPAGSIELDLANAAREDQGSQQKP